MPGMVAVSHVRTEALPGEIICDVPETHSAAIRLLAWFAGVHCQVDKSGNEWEALDPTLNPIQLVTAAPE